MSGRLPDPGLAAICAHCEEPREAHGGANHLGACPGESGLYARRFSLQAADRYDPQECTACMDYYRDRPHLTGACASVGLEHGMSTEQTVRAVLADYHQRGHRVMGARR